MTRSAAPEYTDDHEKAVTEEVAQKLGLARHQAREYARFACDSSNVAELRQWQSNAPDFLPPHLKPGTRNQLKDVQLAVRIWLFDRDQALKCLECIFSSENQELVDLQMMANASLLQHFTRSTGGSAVVIAGLASNLIRGIATLSVEIEQTRSSDAFRASCAVSHKLQSCRLLLLIYSTRQITLDGRGNWALPDYPSAVLPGQQQLAAPPPSPQQLPSHLGGELLELILCILKQSEQLWSSTEHGDANPQWSMVYTLCMALMVALDYYVPKLDVDLKRVGFFNRFLARAVAQADPQASNTLGELLQRLIDLHLVRRPPPRDGSGVGLVPADPWAHKGFKAVVIFAGAHWFHGLFRMIIGEDDDAERPPGTSVMDGNISAAPQSFVVIPGMPRDQSAEVKRTLMRMVSDALSAPGKALHMLSRIMASPSFACMPSKIRKLSVELINHVTAEFVRMGSSPDMQVPSASQFGASTASGEQSLRDLIFRSRGSLLQSTGSRHQISDVEVPDCIEDLIILQAQIVRSRPDLACNFWCLRGSAESPYIPSGSLEVTSLLNPDQQADDADLIVDDQSGINPPMWAYDDGHAIGVRSTADGSRLDPVSYLRCVATTLQQDMVRAIRSSRRAADARPVHQLFAAPEETGGLIDDDTVLDLITHAGPTGSAGAPLDDAGRVSKRLLKSTRRFLSLYSDLLAALAAGPLCANGKTCAASLASFVGAPSPSTSTAAGTPGADMLGGFGLGMPGQRPPASSTVAAAPELPSCLHAQGLVSTLAVAASEIDPDEQARRGRKYAAEHADWLANRDAQEVNVLMRLMGNGVGAEPPPPDVRRPCLKVVTATLRTLQSLCTDGGVRNALCALQIPLPARSMPDDASVSSSPSALESSMDSYVALGGGLAYGGAAYRGAGRGGRSTDLISILFHLLKLSVGVRTKGAILTLLARIAEGSKPHSSMIRDMLESAQIIRTIPLVAIDASADLKQDLDTVETRDQTYDATLAFCDLLRVLHAHTPLHSMGAGQRQPGIIPHLRFLIDDLLLKHKRRPVRASHAADTWKLAFAPLSVIFDIVRSYTIHSPPKSDATTAVAASLRVGRTLEPASKYPEAPQAMPTALVAANNSSMAPGTWSLCACEISSDQKTFTAAFETLKQCLSAVTDNPRVALLSEVCTYLGGCSASTSMRTGGRFRGWTSDGVLVAYDSASSDLPKPVQGTTANKIWFLLDGPLPSNPAFRPLVQMLVQLTPEAAARAAGYSAGDPYFDFVPTLPELPITVQRSRDGAVTTDRVQAPRSVGFELMRRILRGDELFRCILSIITQAGCDDRGPAGRGVISLADAAERQDSASHGAIAYRAGCIDAEIKAAARKDTSIFGRMEVLSSSISGEQADARYPTMLAPVAERTAEEAIADEILHGMRGVPPSCESTVTWREKTYCLAVSLLDAVMARDAQYMAGARGINLTDPLVSMPKLLMMSSAAVYIARAASYRQDPHIGVMASRVLYRLATLRISEFPPADLVNQLLAPSTEPGLTSKAVIAGTADAMRDRGRSWDEDLRDSLAHVQNRDRIASLKNSAGAAVASSASALSTNLNDTIFQNADATLIGGRGSSAPSISSATLAQSPLAITCAGVALPIGIHDGPCGAGGNFKGWASDDASDKEGHTTALDVRQGILLEVIRGSIEHAASSHGGNVSPASRSALSIGHLLLGITSRDHGSIVTIAPLNDLTCLSVVTDMLHPYHPAFCITRRPRVAESAMRVLLAGLHDDRIGLSLLKRLEDIKAAIDADVGAPKAGDRFLSRLLSQLKPSLPLPASRVENDGAAVVDVAAGDSGSPSSYVSAFTQQGLAYRNVISALTSAAAIEVHLLAISTAVNPVPAIAELSAAAQPLLASVGGNQAFIQRGLSPTSLALIRQRPGPPPPVIQHLTSLVEALAGKRSMQSAMDDAKVGRYAQTGSGKGAGVHSPLGHAVQVGPATLQSYDITVLRALLIDRAQRLEAQQTAEAGGAPVVEQTLHLTMLLALDGAWGVTTALDEEAQSALAWAEAHNAHVLSLRTLYSQCASYSQLASALLHHVLPDPNPEVAAAGCDAATQGRRQVFFLERLEQVLTRLAEAAAADPSAAPPALILLPLAELALATAQRLRASCPSVRASEAQCKRLLLLASRIVTARAAPIEADNEIDSGAPSRLRGLVYAVLLQLTMYCMGAQPSQPSTASAGDAATPFPASVLRSPPLSQEHRNASASGWIAALREDGSSLALVIASDVCNSTVRARPLAAVLLAALLQPPMSAGEATTCGIPSLYWVSGSAAALPELLLLQLMEVKGELLRTLHGSGALRGVLGSLSSLDAIEAKFTASSNGGVATGALHAARTGAAYDVLTAWGYPSVDGVADGFTPASRTMDSRAQKLLRFDWAADAGSTASGRDNDDGVADENAGIEEHATSLAYDFTLHLIVCAALAHEQGPDALLHNDLLSTVGKLTWFQRCSAYLTDLRSQSLGLAGSNIDSTIASELAHKAPRLQAVLQLLSAAMAAHPKDAALASAMFGWLQRHYVLLDLAVQAALSTRTNIACLRLMRAFVDLLQRIALVKGTIDSGIAQSTSNGGRPSPLDASRADEIAIRLFQRFALQPRAVKAPSRVPGRFDANASFSGHAMRSWVEAVAPQSQEEIRWAATALPVGHPLAIANVVATAFAVHALTAGEHLCWAVASYCRARTAAALPTLLGAAFPRHSNAARRIDSSQVMMSASMSSTRSTSATSSASSQPLPVILFRAPDQVASGK